MKRTPLKRTPLRGTKHARTKATDIPRRVKDTVWERDGHRCVWCQSPNAQPEAHYIPRSHGGLGVPENILTLCRVKYGGTSCHDLYDHGPAKTRAMMRRYFAGYLSGLYEGWSEDKLIYRR